MKVIAVKNLPARLPIQFSAIVWLLADRLNMAGWAQGVTYTLLGVLWGVCVYGVATQEQTDIMGNGK